MSQREELAQVEMPKLQVTNLPRGGVVIDTELGPVQVGLPPETIKDSMKLGIQVPRYFIVPFDPFVKTFGPNMGVNVAEFEFPAYCNFFFKRQSVHLIVESHEMEQRFRRVFQETLFGPKDIDIEQDFEYGTAPEDMPDLTKELGYFRKFGSTLMEMDMLLTFSHFDEHGVTFLGDKNQIRIEATRDNHFLLTDSNGMACVSSKIHVPIPPPIDDFPEVFHPPEFGVTVLGNSHGFDPNGSTSGYVLWINRRGFMIDPPPFSSIVLQNNRIPPVLIDGIIVTHCHADHDAGTFQKILQEGRIMIITTRTIYGSFIRKYSAMSGLQPSLLQRVAVFRAVRVNTKHMIRGACFRFFYALHSIPCIGFEVEYGGKSIAFSGDHLNDPDRINALAEEGILPSGRKEELLNFPWHCDVILHEAGVPPIHTPIKTLADLSGTIKEKLYVVHSAAKDVPDNVQLKRAPEGVQNTIFLDIESPPHSSALEILDLLRRIDIFSSLTLDDAYELLQMAKRKQYQKEQVVVAEGTKGDCFYVIVSGEANVIIGSPSSNADNTGKFSSNSTPVVKRYIVGDYFGEQALITDKGTRTADIIASSTLDLLEFSTNDLQSLRGDSSTTERILHLAQSREQFVWKTLSKNSVFGSLSTAQKTQLELVLTRKEITAGEKLWVKGDTTSFAVFIESGEFEITEGEVVRKRRRSIKSAIHPATAAMVNNSHKQGTFIGDIDRLMLQASAEDNLSRHDADSIELKLSPRPPITEDTLTAVTNGSVLVIEQDALFSFLTRNPGVLLAIRGNKVVT